MIARRRSWLFVLASLWLPSNPAIAGGQTVPPAPSSAPSSQLFLVLPFEEWSTGPRYAWLGEGLAELFTDRLAGDQRLVFPRSEWLAAVEKLGLPPSPRFTRASMLRIAKQMDADYVVYGQYSTDGKGLTITTHILQIAPAALSPAFTETGALEDLMDVQARASWHVARYTDSLYPINQSAYVQKFPRYRLDAFEQFIRGLLASDEQRLRNFREASRLDPDWPDPAFAMGETYFATRNCDPALIWLSRVPPGHRRGLEASFLAGVCHLWRHDAARAESAFAGMLSAIARLHPRAQAPAEVFNNLAIAQSRQGKHREAVEHWQRAQQLDTDHPDYSFNAAVGSFRAGEFAAAARAFRDLLKRYAQDGDVRTLLIVALERAGRATEAAATKEECSTENCGASAAVQEALRAPAVAASGANAADRFAKVERVSSSLDASALLFAFRTQPESSAAPPARQRSSLREVLAVPAGGPR